jgi:hypothetical protein
MKNLKERYLSGELDVDGRVVVKPSLNGSLCKGELESADSTRSSVLGHVETVMNRWIPHMAGNFLATGTDCISWRWNLGCRFTKNLVSNWLRHVTRMYNRMPKIMLNYRPNGRRRLGRSLNRLLDEAETCLSGPN